MSSEATAKISVTPAGDRVFVKLTRFIARRAAAIAVTVCTFVLVALLVDGKADLERRSQSTGQAVHLGRPRRGVANATRAIPR